MEPEGHASQDELAVFPRGVPESEPPPILDRWPRVYAAVLCYLALLIAVLYVFTRLFRY